MSKSVTHRASLVTYGMSGVPGTGIVRRAWFVATSTSTTPSAVVSHALPFANAMPRTPG